MKIKNYFEKIGQKLKHLKQKWKIVEEKFKPKTKLNEFEKRIRGNWSKKKRKIKNKSHKSKKKYEIEGNSSLLWKKGHKILRRSIQNWNKLWNA